ncbi:MAG: hypothetical protein IJ507_00490, partial [Clostridia bacterium]|nr:hypothetical protein [Clostridia bacterium]
MKKTAAVFLAMLLCCICLPAFAAIPSFLNAFPKNTDVAVYQPLFKKDPVPFPTVELEVDEKSGKRTYTISGLKAWGVPKKAFREWSGNVIPQGSPSLDDQVRVVISKQIYDMDGFRWNYIFGGIEQTGVYEDDNGCYVLFLQTKTGAIRIRLDGSRVDRSYSIKSTNHYLIHDGDGYLISASSNVKEKKQTLYWELERVHPRTRAIKVTRLRVVPVKKGQPEVTWDDGHWLDESREPTEAPAGIDPSKPSFKLTGLPEETPADTQPGVIDFNLPEDGLYDQWPLAAPLPVKPEMTVTVLPDGRISRTFTGLEAWGLADEEWGVWEYQTEDDSWLHTQTTAEKTLTLIAPEREFYYISLNASGPARRLMMELFDGQFRVVAWLGSLYVARDYEGFAEIMYSLPDQITL